MWLAKTFIKDYLGLDCEMGHPEITYQSFEQKENNDSSAPCEDLQKMTKLPSNSDV